MPKGFDFNSVNDFQTTSDASKKIQMRKDRRMARDDPMRYCADRCLLAIVRFGKTCLICQLNKLGSFVKNAFFRKTRSLAMFQKSFLTTRERTLGSYDLKQEDVARTVYCCSPILHRIRLSDIPRDIRMPKNMKSKIENV